MAKKKPEIQKQSITPPEVIASVSDTYQLDVMSMVEDAIAQRIAAIPDFVFNMSNAELFNKANPTPLEYALRTAFWREYDKLYLNNYANVKMKAKDICNGICTPGYFYNILKKPAVCLWMIKPKQTYHREMEAILSRGIERLWEIIEIPIFDETGKADHRLAGVVLQAIKQVEDRVQGMAVQRTQAVTVNLSDKNPAVTGKSMEDINAKIRELESAINANNAPGRGSPGNSLPPAPKKFETVELRPLQKWDAADSGDTTQEQGSSSSGSVQDS